MERTLKKVFLIVVILCIPVGFFIKHEHTVFLWHKIPSVDTAFGFLGAFFLILAARILASFAQRHEDFYD